DEENVALIGRLLPALSGECAAAHLSRHVRAALPGDLAAVIDALGVARHLSAAKYRARIVADVDALHGEPPVALVQLPLQLDVVLLAAARADRLQRSADHPAVVGLHEARTIQVPAAAVRRVVGRGAVDEEMNLIVGIAVGDDDAAFDSLQP